MKKQLALSTNQLRLSPDKQKILLLISQVEGDVSAIDIINLIKISEYKYFKVDKDGLKKAIQGFQGCKHKESEQPEFESVVIAERRDAELSITFDPLKITAKAHITTAYAGKKISVEQLQAEMQKLNIKVGIRHNAINLLLEKSAQAAAGSCFQITIAEGRQPVDGQDAYFRALITPPRKQLIDSIRAEYGSTDMSDVENIVTVRPGTGLIRKFPHKAGQDGLAVTGEVIAHRVGIDIPFHIGTNTNICESDPNLLVSAVHGTPVALEVGMKIEPSLLIESIAKNSPPIHHNGTLVIKGDVPAGTSITATGDITVIGFIESSQVKCGGDLFVSKGILGEKVENNRGELTSKVECTGSIYANFIQFATIKIGGNLNLQYQLLHSNIFCNGYINVQDKEKKRGAIFGGYLYSRKGIRTVTLGASADIKTTIDLNGCYSELLNNKKRLTVLMEQTQDKLQYALTAQHKLSKLEDSEKSIQLNKRLALTIKEIKNQLSVFDNKIKDNQNEIQQFFNNTNVIAAKTIYSSVSVSLGDEIFRSTQKYGATTVHIKNHKLIAESSS